MEPLGQIGTLQVQGQEEDLLTAPPPPDQKFTAQ